MQRNRATRISRSIALAAAITATLAVGEKPVRAESGAPRAPMSYYEVRRGLFGMSKIESAPIVMLGDSLTEAGPWTDLTGCLNIASRGIGGDTTTRMLNRLDEVLALRPRAIFLMIGVNDVSLGHPLETTVTNLRTILDRLTGAGAQVFVSYVLPVTARYGKRRVNAEVPALNAAIAKLVAERPAVTAIDARPLLRGADGTLREEFAYDGIHLTPKGYAMLRDLIAPHVAKFCTP